LDILTLAPVTRFCFACAVRCAPPWNPRGGRFGVSDGFRIDIIGLPVLDTERGYPPQRLGSMGKFRFLLKSPPLDKAVSGPPSRCRCLFHWSTPRAEPIGRSVRLRRLDDVPTWPGNDVSNFGGGFETTGLCRCRADVRGAGVFRRRHRWL